ncbi:MAG TPA: protease inhibitor I42 family protein [Planctomycetaceae bacterium]|jgi:predicted secreted protein|nr:protease inhibitor I42 family protein [Planctomycetaceae bacterium]
MLPITEEANGKEIELTVGGSFELVLPENRTTGYKWKELPSSEPVITLERVKEGNVPRTAQGNLIAGGGRPAHWRGHATREGTAVLELQCVGPAQQLDKTFKITLRVKPATHPR